MSSPDEAEQNPGTKGPGAVSPHSAPLHAGCSVRPYDPSDEDAAIALWLRTWQAAYPELDFAARLDWWRARWRNELVTSADIVIAEAGSGVIGFVTVDPRTSYLDQIVVAPEHWASGVGTALMAVAKYLSPAGLDLERQHRQCPRHPLLRQAGIFHRRRRRQSDFRQACAPHALAAVTPT